MGPLTPALIGGGLQILAGLFGRSSAKKREEAAANERRILKNKLNYLEISHLLLNSEKKYSLLKKISKHNIILEKVKFLILFLVPKKFFKFIKK